MLKDSWVPNNPDNPKNSPSLNTSPNYNLSSNSPDNPGNIPAKPIGPPKYADAKFTVVDGEIHVCLRVARVTY